MDSPPSEVETYKQNMRNYLTSVTYSNTNSLSTDHLEKYGDELKNQSHIDWNNNDIPFDETNLYENNNIGGRALLWTKHPSCDGKVCFDYVMDTCGDRGVNPALCIGMSITESGGLNHTRFPGTYDFGCLSSEPNNIQSGLSCLTDKFFYSNTPRNGIFVRDMHFNDMWLQFAGKNFESSSYGNLKNFLAQATKQGDVGYSTQACIGEINPITPIEGCFPGTYSCQNDDYSMSCKDDGSWETPTFCAAGCNEVTGQCAEIPVPPPTQGEGLFCRELCIYHGNTAGECSNLPSCPDDTVYETYCRQLCIADGVPPSQCSSFPLCEPTPGSEIYCRQICLDAGNSPIECSGLPACTSGN